MHAFAECGVAQDQYTWPLFHHPLKAVGAVWARYVIHNAVTGTGMGFKPPHITMSEGNRSARHLSSDDLHIVIARNLTHQRDVTGARQPFASRGRIHVSQAWLGLDSDRIRSAVGRLLTVELFEWMPGGQDHSSRVE